MNKANNIKAAPKNDKLSAEVRKRIAQVKTGTAQFVSYDDVLAVLAAQAE